jgi:hypothetical protein
MGRSREIWYARLAGAVGMGLRETPESEEDATGFPEMTYQVYIGVELTRDPDRQVYLNMTTAETRRLIKSLQDSVERAENENEKRSQ